MKLRLFAAIIMASSLTSSVAAFAHAVCGDRIFPATLGIDDPGVGDELALPTVSYVGGSTQSTDTAFSYTKTILPGLGLSIQGGQTNAQGATTSDALQTEVKYNFLCKSEHEFMASAGFKTNWANTGSTGVSTSYNIYSPVLDMGLGFGSLPSSLNALRPLAMTFELSETIPDPSSTDALANDYDQLNWGFTVQYSLPYYNSHISEIKNDFFKHIIPITEFSFSMPISNISNTPTGTNVITGYIQPGFIYSADTWQFALEATIPINSATGSDIGVKGELHFFFDDIFPQSIGKPIFN